MKILQHGPERGAILVLTSISMILLLAFTAIAVDMGQRNQQLAGAQHAIDAAVITAAEYLAREPGDYDGAMALVKEVVRQNLGIDPRTWDDCDDPDHLAITVTGETTCISFHLIPETPTAREKNDIRVRLPHFRMQTVFGAALGIDSLDLAATAASNGTNCGTAENPCGNTEPDATPTTTLEPYCADFTWLTFAVDAELWDECRQFYPDEDITVWQDYVCSNTDVSIPWQGVDIDYTIDGVFRFIWYWESVCEPYVAPAVREAWLGEVCWADDLTLVFEELDLWFECRDRWPSIEDWDEYHATTTTGVPSTDLTTSTAHGPTTIRPTTTPGSIDLSS